MPGCTIWLTGKTQSRKKHSISSTNLLYIVHSVRIHSIFEKAILHHYQIQTTELCVCAPIFAHTHSQFTFDLNK